VNDAVDQADEITTRLTECFVAVALEEIEDMPAHVSPRLAEHYAIAALGRAAIKLQRRMQG